MTKQEQQEFDPKLKEAMAKIEAIAKEYEVGFSVALASKTHAEFKTDFPEWSLIKFENGGLRVRAKSAEPELTDSSLHLLFSMRDMVGGAFMFLDNLCKEVQKVVPTIEHKPFGGKLTNKNQKNKLKWWQ